MSLPATTGPAAAVFVSDKIRLGRDVRCDGRLLLARLGSLVAAATSAVLVMAVPSGVLGETRTTTVKVADAPRASVPMVPVMVPVPPTAGLVRVNVVPKSGHRKRRSC